MHSSAGMSADAHPPDVFPRAYDTTSSPGKGSPQRLHQPTPVSSPHRFQQMLPPNEDEAEDKYGTGFQARNYSVSPPKASGMTLAAVAAAAAAASEATYSSAYQAQQSVFQESGQQGTGVTPPVSSEIPQSSSSPKRLFIHPYSRNQVLTAPPNSAPLSNPELTMAPSATSSTSTSLSSAATFSTHDPPTPSTSASVTMMDFIGASKATAVASGAGAFTDYVPQATTDQSMPPQQQPLRIFPRNEQASQVQYENPPQTAPLPARSSSFDEENYSHPPTPATAYPNLHYAQYPMSPALAAAAEHHSQYPGKSLLMLSLPLKMGVEE